MLRIIGSSARCQVSPKGRPSTLRRHFSVIEVVHSAIPALTPLPLAIIAASIPHLLRYIFLDRRELRRLQTYVTKTAPLRVAWTRIGDNVNLSEARYERETTRLLDRHVDELQKTNLQTFWPPALHSAWTISNFIGLHHMSGPSGTEYAPVKLWLEHLRELSIGVDFTSWISNSDLFDFNVFVCSCLLMIWTWRNMKNSIVYNPFLRSLLLRQTLKWPAFLQDFILLGNPSKKMLHDPRFLLPYYRPAWANEVETAPSMTKATTEGSAVRKELSKVTKAEEVTPVACSAVAGFLIFGSTSELHKVYLISCAFAAALRSQMWTSKTNKIHQTAWKLVGGDRWQNQLKVNVPD